MGVDGTTRNLISTNFPYQWQDSGITYLGITLTKSAKQMFHTNFSPFKNQFAQDLQSLSKSEFSWTGRLAAFKMLVLPKLLYLFRSLLICNPKHYLRLLQFILTNYIWQGKKSCCVYLMLTKHRSIRGSSLPDLTDYYHVTILSQLKGWFHPQIPCGES